MRTEYDSLYIGGQWLPAATGERITVVSPHTGRPIGSTPCASEEDVERAVAVARQAFDSSPWPHLAPEERAEAVTRLLAAYQERIPEMTEIVIAEMGSPRWFAELAQGPGGAAMLSTFLDAARTVHWEEPGSGHNAGALVRREAVGVVGAITPWNVPQLVIMPKLAPALLAGCTIVVKAAPESPLDALLLAEIVHEARLPDGVVSILVGGREAGEHLVRHSGVDKVAFTGSSAVGRRIAAICGERLARCSLELGGKSAAIVLRDADLARTAEGLKFASFLNNGQACVAQTRVLVPRSRYAESVDALASMVGEIAVGDPGDASTYVGPLVARRQQERVLGYLRQAEDEGARTVVGGTARPAGSGDGWYVAPTLLADVDNAMTVAQEEIFGPVVCVIPYDDEDDAVRIANDSPFGLAGSVWSKDRARAGELARKMRTGMVGINGFAPDLWSPFGGYKQSGIGREYGPVGLESYLEYKSIYGGGRVTPDPDPGPEPGTAAAGASPFPASDEHAPMAGIDEFLIHNAPYPVRVMWTPDAQAYERVWFTCEDKVGELLVVIGLAFYPNLGTAEAFAIANVRGRHTTVRAHKKCPTDRMDMSLGPFQFQVVEPFRQWHLTLDAAEHGLTYDITWLDTKRPVFRQLGAGIIVGGRAISPVAGYDGFGRQDGWVEAHGERFELTQATHLGTRDHHWGTRDGVGGPGRYMGMQHPHSGEWVEFEDFGIWGDHVLYNIGDARKRSGTLANRVHRMRFEPETHLLQSGEVDLVFADGTVTTMSFERLGNQIAFLRCGMYGGPNGGTPDGDLWHGMPVAIGDDVVVHGETFDVNDPDVRRRLAGQDQHHCRVTCDGEVTYGLVEPYDTLCYDVAKAGVLGFSILDPAP